METSVTEDGRKIWIRVPDSRIDVLITSGYFYPEPFTDYTTEDLNALVHTTIAGFCTFHSYR